MEICLRVSNATLSQPTQRDGLAQTCVITFLLFFSHIVIELTSHNTDKFVIITSNICSNTLSPLWVNQDVSILSFQVVPGVTVKRPTFSTLQTKG